MWSLFSFAEGRQVAMLCLVTLGLLVLLPTAGMTQEANVYRVGMLLQGAPAPPGTGLFIPPMRDLGYIEGQNLIVERRFAEGRSERFQILANELVALNPHVIVAESTAGALAAKRATSTIPVVIVNVSDPVASGLVQSLARSENNITGSTDFGTELAVKSVEYLLAVVPKASRIAVLMSDNPIHPVQLEAIREAARQVGVAIFV